MWHDRMNTRHKYWSSSHGFKFGRSLARWAEGEENEENEGEGEEMPGD